MKFTNGMWHVKEGVEIYWMSHIERSAIRGKEVDLLLARYTRGRGDTLNAPTVSAIVRSPREGIIATKFTHWAGEHDIGPNFPLLEEESHSTVEDQPGKSIHYATGPLKLDIRTGANELAFQYSTGDQAKKLTGHSWRSIAYVADRTSSNYDPNDQLYTQNNRYILLELDLAVNEKIYGLGERFGPFVRNGQSLEIWNEDGGTSSEQAYKNIPLYISSRGYGVFVNSPARIMYEVQSERTTRINIVVKAESLEYMVIAGPTPKDILRRYTALTGRPPLPPAWSYGLWLTTSFTTSYDEKTVTSFLKGFEERSIPLSVFHFDAFWMKSYQWCDFTFDADMFPDPASYLSTLKHDRGLRLSVWLNSYVAQSSPLFAEGKKNGYFIMRSDTAVPTVWQWDRWQAGMAIVDFTNPDAAKWFASHLRKLMDLGIDSFKTDFGERIPFERVKYHDGSDPARMHNFYTYLYNKCVYETMTEYYKEKELTGKEIPILFARSATAGTQQFPVHWSGDSESTFEAMAETLRGGLSLALSGFAFWAHDIGGFEGLPPPALYKRWVQFGLLSSHSRLHGSSSFRVPWIYEDHPELGGKAEAEECSKVLRDMTRLKLSLLPYLLSQALQARDNGTPMLRPLLMEFGEFDQNVWNIDTQYMLGDNLLVAPIFSEDGEVTFYVPRTSKSTAGSGQEENKAVWRSWFDHKKTYAEGDWYTETHGFDTLPLLVRPGAVIEYNPKLERADGDIKDGLKVLVNGPLEAEAEVQIILPERVNEVSGRRAITSDGWVTGKEESVKAEIVKMHV